MRELIPLEKVVVLDDALRKRLAAFWITSVEELVSTARAGNARYGSGRAALALALGVTEDALGPIISAAGALLPQDTPFDVPVEEERGEGLFLDQYDDLDAAAFATPVSLPETVEPLFTLPRPQNQGVRNSCVAFSLAAAYQILSRDPTDLSEQFLYWAAKSRDGIPGDVGTDPIKAIQAFQTLGVCSEATWPYTPAPRDDRNPGHGPPPQAAHAEAQRRRLRGFQKLPATSVIAIRSALAAGKPVLIGLRIWEHWSGSWQGGTLGRLRAALPGELQRGGHAMCVVGYRSDPTAPGQGYFIVRNSWGPAWAKENSDGPGYCHVPYKLVADQGLAAIALEGGAGRLTSPPGGTQATTGQGGPTARLGGGAPSLAELYAEAQDLHVRAGALVADLRLLLGEASAGGTPRPAEGEPAAPGGLANLPSLDLDAPELILDLRSSAADPGNEELYPNGLSPEGRPLLRIDSVTASALASNRLGREPRERLLLYGEKRTAMLRQILLKNGPPALEQLSPDERRLLAELTGDPNLSPARLRRLTERVAGDLGAVAGIDLTRLEQARWAVVINALEDSALLKAIWPLIAHRMGQMGHQPPAVTFRDGESAGAWVSRHTAGGKKTLRESWGQVPPVLLYNSGERVNAWLDRPPHRVASGPVDPRRGVPFYLMLIGRPGPVAQGDETFIPFSFQYELDIFWGVGRLCFADAAGQHRLTDYARYAEHLVQFEQRAKEEAAARLRKEVVYFATRHEGDPSTLRSADELVRPLAEWSARTDDLPARLGFSHSAYVAGQATRANLETLLSGGADGKAPAILFSATHGLGGLPLGDERLVTHTGSLVLANWSGYGNVQRGHWFAGEDLAGLGERLKLEGTMAVLFACYGAGCPAYDEFLFDAERRRPQIAPFALVAQLAQQLLLHGALAVLGHVERAWTYSFRGTEGTAGQSQPFEDVLGRLMQGWCAGHATDQFNAIQGARATALADELEKTDFGMAIDPLAISRLWMARNDARNYALLGDPAARLPY